MSIPAPTALDRARRKAYVRLLPLLFLSYLIAYVDRSNVSIAALKMTTDLKNFDNAVIGIGSGIFFLGYFLLEIPGSLLVEKWSARKWISRIMISWGIVAALTALVRTPWQFYTVRFLLGLAEAGFFPGVLVYLTHWFPSRDRGRAMAGFFIATPIAQMISPKLSNLLLKIGSDGNPLLLGMQGWQWVYIAWGIPAIVLGVLVILFLTDRPGQARWLEADERTALETELKKEKSHHAIQHMRLVDAFRHPKVLLLAAAYFFIVTGNYGVEFFMPTILKKWYNLNLDSVTWLVVLPPIGSLVGQYFVGWNSDRMNERRLHTVLPILFGAAALFSTQLARHPLWLTVTLFIIAMTGLKAYLPAFWSLPSLFLTEAAAAGAFGLINSVGNLGGFLGPTVLGTVESVTGSFRGGIVFLCVSMVTSAMIVLLLGLGGRAAKSVSEPDDAFADAVVDPV